MTKGHAHGLASRPCALFDCGVHFVPAQHTQRYCCPDHQQEAGLLRRALPLVQRYLGWLQTQLRERG